jgi:molybdate transport system substrate-binding protein
MAWLCLGHPGPPPITVSAAASLTDALEEIARAYAGAGGGPVRYNFAGSNVLARQVAAGAPVDLFISADAAQMEVAQAAGAIDERTRINLLGNRLAIVARPGTSMSGVSGLTQPAIRRIAIGNPDGVPSGVYARRYLEAIGLWIALQPRLVPVGNVRAALTAVENGSADAAIVYESDTVASSRVAVAAIISGPDAPRIVYPAAVVRASPQRADAERFLAFLRSPAASAIFSRWKLAVLPAASR